MFTKADIEKYFNAEKSESLFFILIGLAGILLAIVFYFFIKTSVYKGAAIPLLLLGLLLGIVGYTVYTRTDADRISNVYAYGMDPSALKNKELPRMKKVMKNFVLYRWAEIGLAIIGVGLFYYFKNNAGKEFWKGFGFALAMMALLALAADYFAEKRGKIYIEGIESFVK
jgi:drug/metabolite transporter (DMT)-like permease